MTRSGCDFFRRLSGRGAGRPATIRRLVVVQLAGRFLPEKLLLTKVHGPEGRFSNNRETANLPPHEAVNDKGRWQAGVEAAPDGVSGLGHTHFVLLGDLRNCGLSVPVHSGLLGSRLVLLCAFFGGTFCAF